MNSSIFILFHRLDSELEFIYTSHKENGFSGNFPLFSQEKMMKITKDDQSAFNEEVNMSYLPKDLPLLTNRQIIKHYVSSLLVYGTALFVVWNNHWYGQLLSAKLFGKIPITGILLAMYIAYVLIAPFVYMLSRPKSLWRSKPLLIIGYLKRFFLLGREGRKSWISGKSKDILPTRDERQALLFFFVKFFFGPQMLQYALTNFTLLHDFLISNLSTSFSALLDAGKDIPREVWIAFQTNLYAFLITSFFFIDTLIFACGYFWEAGFLKNKLRSVEDTAFGILVCLICYPPFNTFTSTILNWVPSDQATFFNDPSHTLTWVFRWTALSFLLIYTAASVALFTKASNLTNRGIVTIFPYNIVRHPAYIGKNLHWWLTGIPVIATYIAVSRDTGEPYLWGMLGMIFSLASWTFIYYLRAVTEERHLMKDPDYRAYVAKVKYRFIPGVF